MLHTFETIRETIPAHRRLAPATHYIPMVRMVRIAGPTPFPLDTRGSTMRVQLGLLTVLAVMACGHSEAFVNVVPPVDPPSAAADERLTYNTDQDYWPSWTQDGQGILYSFVDLGSSVKHRCVGLLPAGGGARIWQLCDNRATQGDSINSIAAYALDASGQLLYVESASNIREITALPTVSLWRADTARPFARTRLLTLPQVVGGVTYSWLADLRWTSATTFTALAQSFETVAHCFPRDPIFCSQQDTIFFSTGAVLNGTINGASVTLTQVDGTDGATSYSLAEGGASIVFTRLHELRLFKVAAIGGTATAVASIPQGAIAELPGVSCQGTTCVVASAPISPVRPEGSAHPFIAAGTSRLSSVSLVSGTVTTLVSAQVQAASFGAPPQPTYSTPQLAPNGTDVVMQVGGTWWGHIQTYYAGGNADLHLYPGIVH